MQMAVLLPQAQTPALGGPERQVLNILKIKMQMPASCVRDFFFISVAD